MGIERLEDLVTLIGKEKVDALFLEYFMLLVGKSRLLDQVNTVLEEGCGMEDIKYILEGDLDGEDLYNAD